VRRSAGSQTKQTSKRKRETEGKDEGLLEALTMTSSFSGLAAFSSLGFGGFLHCIHERGRERERERERVGRRLDGRRSVMVREEDRSH
jgi:hypothetical protein